MQVPWHLLKAILRFSEWCSTSMWHLCAAYWPAVYRQTGLAAGLKVCGCYSTLTSLEQLHCRMRNATTTLTLTKGLVRQSKYCYTHTQRHAQTHLCKHASTQVHTIIIHAQRHSPLASLVHAHAQHHTRVMEVVEAFFMSKGLFLVYHISPL